MKIMVRLIFIAYVFGGFVVKGQSDELQDHSLAEEEPELLNLLDGSLEDCFDNTYKNIAPFTALLKKIDAFPSHFPTVDNRIRTIAGTNVKKQARIVEQAATSYPLMNITLLYLMKDFLTYKLLSGTAIEKELYAGMSVYDLINRLLTKRPLMFITSADIYLLITGQTGVGGFELIGTSAQQAPLILANYLSYDEMAISALIGVSVPTYFINNGNRTNMGILSTTYNYELEGVYIALVGARFEKPNYMDWELIVVTPTRDQQLKSQAGWFAIWSIFYQNIFETYKQAQYNRTGRYIKFMSGGQVCYFDTIMYKKRMAVPIYLFLRDANIRGVLANKKVYGHVVPLGLGAWQIVSQQGQLLVDAYTDVLSQMQADEIPNVSDLDFSSFPSGLQWNALRKNIQGINIIVSTRNPADKLIRNNVGKLLVAQYEWNSNSFPGNEYWFGLLSRSADPAAACCSTLAELQNPDINPYISAEYANYW